MPGELVKLQDLPGDGSQYSPVVAHQHDARAGALQPVLEQRQAGVVEVVRGLVQQQDVRLGEQDCGQAQPCLLAAGELGRAAAKQAFAEAKLGGNLGHPLWQIRAAESQPLPERGVVGVVSAVLACAQRGERGVQVRLSGGHLSPPLQVLRQRLARAEIGLLSKPEDSRRLRRADDRAAVRLEIAGQDLEQRRLADPVRRDNPGAVAAADAETDAVEDDETAERNGDVDRRKPGHLKAPRITAGCLPCRALCPGD